MYGRSSVRLRSDFFLSHGRDVANMAKDVRRLPIKRRSKTISTIPTILTLSVNHILNATTAVNKTRDAESEEKAFQLSDRFLNSLYALVVME